MDLAAVDPQIARIRPLQTHRGLSALRQRVVLHARFRQNKLVLRLLTAHLVHACDNAARSLPDPIWHRGKKQTDDALREMVKVGNAD